MLGPRDGRAEPAVLPVQATVTATLRAHGLCLLYTGPCPLGPPRTPLQGQVPLGLGVRFQSKAALPPEHLQSGGGTNTQPPDSAVEVSAVPAELAQGGHLAWGPEAVQRGGPWDGWRQSRRGLRGGGSWAPKSPRDLERKDHHPGAGAEQMAGVGRGEGRGAGGEAQSLEGSLGLSLAFHQQKSGLSPRKSPLAHHVLIYSPSVRGQSTWRGLRSHSLTHRTVRAHLGQPTEDRAVAAWDSRELALWGQNVESGASGSTLSINPTLK